VREKFKNLLTTALSPNIAHKSHDIDGSRGAERDLWGGGAFSTCGVVGS